MGADTLSDKFDIFYNQLVNKGGYELVLEGLKNTILISVCALVAGVIIGTFVAIIITRNKKNKTSSLSKFYLILINSYVEFFRGTPIVVQLLFIYFVILPIIGLNGINAIIVAVLIFSLNSGAYVSEIIRSGILSVDIGQNEAARALGLNESQTMRFIIFPQAIKNALPALGNEFITLLKETSVANYIAVNDLTYAFKSIGSSSYEFMIPYFFLALCYLILVIIASMFVKKLERKLRESDKY